MNLKYMFQQFSDIVEPPRGGVRGGQDQFSWETVRMDKDRENYLGHSIKAPVGRSQGGPDFMWYNKERTRKEKKEAAEMSAERRRVIELERQAMSKALGVPMLIPTVPAQKAIKTTENSEKIISEKKDKKSEKDKKNGKNRDKNHEKQSDNDWEEKIVEREDRNKKVEDKKKDYKKAGKKNVEDRERERSFDKRTSKRPKRSKERSRERSRQRSRERKRERSLDIQSRKSERIEKNRDKLKLKDEYRSKDKHRRY